MPQQREEEIARMMRYWPIIIVVGSVIAGASVAEHKISTHTTRLNAHERRLRRVELNAAYARINTDALVLHLMGEREAKRLRAQVKDMPTYIFEDDKEDEGEE